MPLYRVFLTFPKPPGKRKKPVRCYITHARTPQLAIRTVRNHHAEVYPQANPHNVPQDNVQVSEVASGVYLAIHTYVE